MKHDFLEMKKCKLLHKASNMIDRDGYDGFKVASLAKAGAVSISTIYALFESKEGIYLAYIELKIAQLFDAINDDEALEPVQRLKRYVSMVFGMAKQGRPVLEQGLRNNPLFFAAHHNEFAESARKLFGFLSKCFMDLNPSLNPQQAKRLAYGFNGYLHGYLQYWVVTDGALDTLADEVCEQYICLATQCHDDSRKESVKERGA